MLFLFHEKGVGFCRRESENAIHIQILVIYQVKGLVILLVEEGFVFT